MRKLYNYLCFNEVCMKNFIPEFLGVLFALLLLNVWYLSSLAIEKHVIPAQYNYLLMFLSPAFGALGGAFFAFKLNLNKEKRRENNEKAAKLNRALIHLALQLNVIVNIRTFLGRHENIHEQAFNMRAEKNFNENVTFVDIGDISLILSNNPQLLLELSVEQDGFIQTIESLKIRHDFFLKELHPLMINLGMTGIINTEEIKVKLPKHIYEAAYQVVDVVNQNVQQAEIGLRAHTKINALIYLYKFNSIRS